MHGYNDGTNFSTALASCVRRLAASIGLTLLCIATAWAGRGDIDPNYGEGGRLAIVAGAQLALPGDRLAIADVGEEGFHLPMVDATGQNVSAFGDDGDVSIGSLSFYPHVAALAPNGDMIFMGPPGDTGRALLRLDSAGQPILSFGNRGDGLVDVFWLNTERSTSLALDLDGRILLAEGSRNPGGGCESPARLQRLLADGQPDAAFAGGAVIDIPDLDICNGAAVFGARADGSVIVGDGHAIVAFDASGAIDPTFGVDGWRIFTELGAAKGLMLPDDSLLIIGSSDEAAGSDTAFLKFDRNGQPDLDFGHGAGSVTVDLGAELLGEPFAREDVEQLVLDPDGEHMVADLRLWHADGSLACNGIARLSIDGVPDTSFGRNGLTCLNLNFALVAAQSDGAPLFLAGYYADSILRLLTDNSPSPGLLTGVVTTFDVGESESTVTVTVERLAGRDGAVSADFSANTRHVRYECGGFDPSDGEWEAVDCWTDGAIANRDYTATSGRLDWASGDDTQRTVSVRIVDDGIHENTETFGIDFSEPGGGVQLFTENLTFSILDNDTATTTPPPPPGGAGSVSWATPLALLALLFFRRRQVHRVVRSGRRLAFTQ